MYVVSVTPDPEHMVSEMLRVCRPGGQLVIVNHFRTESSLVRGVEKLLRPLHRLVNFRADLDREQFLRCTGLRVQRSTQATSSGIRPSCAAPPTMVVTTPGHCRAPRRRWSQNAVDGAHSVQRPHLPEELRQRPSRSGPARRGATAAGHPARVDETWLAARPQSVWILRNRVW